MDTFGVICQRVCVLSSVRIRKNIFRVLSLAKKTAMEEESKPTPVQEGDQHLNLKVDWKMKLQMIDY